MAEILSTTGCRRPDDALSVLVSQLLMFANLVRVELFSWLVHLVGGSEQPRRDLIRSSVDLPSAGISCSDREDHHSLLVSHQRLSRPPLHRQRVQAYPFRHLTKSGVVLLNHCVLLQ
jgi:hypothetical protein